VDGGLQEAESALSESGADVVILDTLTADFPAGVQPGVEDARLLLRRLQAIRASVKVVAASDMARVQEAVAFVRAGAAGMVVLPPGPGELLRVIDEIRKTHQLHLELDYLRSRAWRVDTDAALRSTSVRMGEVIEAIRAVAETDAPVLLTGETGTGKGVVARAIHALGRRRERPFVSVHCGAIPDNLLESEMFGHERGAFTGAIRRKAGRFQVAHRGTILLDEVGTLGLALQVKLLQVLQERTVQMIGSESAVEVDVRVIAATNEDLQRRKRDGTFRADLFYRLNVVNIELPPLRERREDLPELAVGILQRVDGSYGRGISGFRDDAMGAIIAYSWPGNIRELENVIERAYVLESGDRIRLERLPAELRAGGSLVGEIPDLTAVRREAIDAAEAAYLAQLLRLHGGRIIRVAAAAGISPRQLRRLLTRHGLGKRDHGKTAM
jgi:DNA-binding NtrC family response regulator